MASIVPGLELLRGRDQHAEDMIGMITELIEEANTNYLKYLAAAATDDRDQAWMRFHASFELEKHIDTLTSMSELIATSVHWKVSRH